MKRITSLFALALSLGTQPLYSVDLYDGLLAYFPLDESSGTVATDISGATAGFHAVFGGTNWFPDGFLGSPPGIFLYYDRSHHFRAHDNSLGEGLTQGLTASAWIYPAALDTWQAIVAKGMSKQSFSFLLNRNPDTGGLRLALIANAGSPQGGSGGGTWFSTREFSSNTLQHVAVTYNGSQVIFYINGVPGTPKNATFTFGSVPDEPLVIAADFPGAVEYFTGLLSSITVYNRALTGVEVAQLKDFRFPKPDPSMNGLWIGYVELNEVQEVATGQWTTAPAPLSLKRIIHIDAAGNPHLLSEATLMRTRVNPPQSPVEVVISDPSKLATHDGVVLRGGKLIGQRFSTATCPLPEPTHRLEFVAGANPSVYDTMTATVGLPAAHPLNPFRHKYHPDLKNGYDLVRTIRFTVPTEFSAQNHSFTGVYEEDVTGLHKDILRARGTITFTRVSTSGLLNP